MTRFDQVSLPSGRSSNSRIQLLSRSHLVLRPPRSITRKEHLDTHVMLPNPRVHDYGTRSSRHPRALSPSRKEVDVDHVQVRRLTVPLDHLDRGWLLPQGLVNALERREGVTVHVANDRKEIWTTFHIDSLEVCA